MRSFLSPDIDLEGFSPEDPDDFSFLLQVIVGPSDSEGAESLQFIVCTPQSLVVRTESDGVIFGRPLVIVDSPDIPRLLNAVKARIEGLEAPDWVKLTNRLARLGFYEFEDSE